MARVLCLLASPRGKDSLTGRMANAFLGAYRQACPEDAIDAVDLWQGVLPEFDARAAAGKYKIMAGEPHGEEERIAWSAIMEIIDRFRAADRYVLATPMWNFGIPYRLKHYLDLVIQPKLTFQVTENGYEGLLTGRDAQLILTRGGNYPEGSPLDFQRPYLEAMFRFVGCEDVKTLVVEPTLGAQAQSEEDLLVAARNAALVFAGKSA